MPAFIEFIIRRSEMYVDCRLFGKYIIDFEEEGGGNLRNINSSMEVDYNINDKGLEMECSLTNRRHFYEFPAYSKIPDLIRVKVDFNGDEYFFDIHDFGPKQINFFRLEFKRNGLVKTVEHGLRSKSIGILENIQIAAKECDKEKIGEGENDGNEKEKINERGSDGSEKEKINDGEDNACEKVKKSEEEYEEKLINPSPAKTAEN